MKISIWWIRRDLRLNDNQALFRALRSGHAVLPVFLFDRAILEDVQEDDLRLTFLYNELAALKRHLEELGSTLLVTSGTADSLIRRLASEYTVDGIYAGTDYDPYALTRDSTVNGLCRELGIGYHTFHDHLIMDPDVILKPGGEPYRMFTPYYKAWRLRFDSGQVTCFDPQDNFRMLIKTDPYRMPEPGELGIRLRGVSFPPRTPDDNLLRDYAANRDYPGRNGTSRIGIHLRFGTVSVRALAKRAAQLSEPYLRELVWREFYHMILFHYPHIAVRSFNPDWERVQWTNNEKAFEAWCRGETGYPLVDAGMRELVESGFMHNRVRMITASFLTRHLLVDWRFGEAFFAKYLLDYDLASNNGGWQWSAGSGCDSAPWFRIFNPATQMKTWDPNLEYVRKWLPEFRNADSYRPPIVDHRSARERAIRLFRLYLHT